MENDNYFLVTFKSVAYAMKFEKTMKSHNIETKIIPVPRSLSTSCGMCGRINRKDKTLVCDILENENITYEKIFEEW